MTGSSEQMEVSCSTGQLHVGKMTADGRSCVLLAFQELFLRDLDRFRGTMGAIGKFR